MSQQLEAQGLDAAEWRELQRLMRQACARLDALMRQGTPDETGSPNPARPGPVNASAATDLNAALAEAEAVVRRLRGETDLATAGGIIGPATRASGLAAAVASIGESPATDVDPALAALEVHVNALLATATQAVQAAQNQGGEIDALLAEIRGIRALAVAA